MTPWQIRIRYFIFFKLVSVIVLYYSALNEPTFMPSRNSLPPTERQIRSRLRQLLDQAEGFLHGSPIELSRKCGKPTCRCASDDSLRHRSLAIGQTRKGKTTMLHVPRPLEAQARRWIDDFQKANALLEALDEQGRLRLEEAKTKARAASSSAKKKGKTGKKSAGKAKSGRNSPPKKKRPFSRDY